jgi:regulatory protein
MATITALEVQKRNKDRVSVYLDGEFAFGLPIEEAARLTKGQTLTDEEISALRAVDAVARAFDRAVNLLARRPYSTAEIRRNLESKEIAPAVIDEALAKLAHLGYVDDRTFAHYWVENRERFRPRGPRALRYELRQKGVAQAIIEDVLAELDPQASAYQAAQEKVRRLRGLDRDEFRQKLSGFLTRRGFGYDIVREVIDHMIIELEENEPEYFTPNET